MLSSDGPSSEGATILVGGPIHAVAGDPDATVEALRIEGRRVTVAGTLAEVRAADQASGQAAGPAIEVDLAGRCVLPGFVDAHTHPLMHGQCASWADLTGASTIDEVVKLLGEHAGQPMIGRSPSCRSAATASA